MKSTAKFFTLLSVLFLLYGCSKPEAPEFKEVQNVNVNLKNFNSASISGDVLFYNPNNKKVTIKSADITVLFEENVVGSINKEFELEVKPQSEFTVPVTIDVPVSKLTSNTISAALGMLSGNKKTIGFEGEVKLKMYGVAFTVPVKYQEKVSIN